MLNQEASPLPLPVDAIKWNRYLLNGTQISNGGRFSEFGIFAVSKDSGREGGLELQSDGNIRDSRGGNQFWSQRLLGLSPDEYRLRLTKGRVMLQLIDPKSQQIAGRLPINGLRYVDLGGVQVVGESGYLIDPIINSDISRKDRRLAAADQGIKPQYLDNSTFVKLLEPDLAGEKVLYLDLHFFDHVGGETRWIDDGVVIDMKTKKLLRRRFEHPLSYERRGVPFTSGRGSSRLEIPTK